jgi:hypothetical protein
MTAGARGVGRRIVLGSVPGVAVALTAGGCASVLGEEDVDAYFKLKPDANGDFYGWSEITISGADPEEDDAIILGASLKAEGSAEDLTFIESIIAEAVTPEARTVLAEGRDFPAGESIVPLDVVHEGGIAQFFTATEDGENKIRIEWTGKANPAATYPDGGHRVDVVIKVDVQ